MPWPRLPHAERDVQFPTGALVELVKVDRAIALIAKDFDQRGSAFFLRRLKLLVQHAEQVHLQGLDEKILRIPTIRTRERQNSTPSWAP